MTITTTSPDPNGINEMIDSFKKVIGYILLYTLKHTSVAGSRVQEECNKEIRRKPRLLVFVPHIFKTQKMCNETVEADPYTLWYVPYQFWMHEMSKRIIEKLLHPMRDVSDHLKTQEICNETVRREP